MILHPILDQDGITLYQSLIRMLQWTVTLGRYDIHHMVMTMSWYQDMAQEDHLAKLKRMFEYLQNFSDTLIVFDIDRFDHSQYDHMKIQHEWKYIYGDVKEEIPQDRPDPRGKSAQTTSFYDANRVHDLVTGRSVSGTLHFVNKTPIESFSKQQIKWRQLSINQSSWQEE